MRNEDQSWLDELRSGYRPEHGQSSDLDFHAGVLSRVQRRRTIRVSATIGCALLIGFFVATMETDSGVEQGTSTASKITMKTKATEERTSFLDEYQSLIAEGSDADDEQEWGNSTDALNEPSLDDYILGEMEPIRFDNWKTSADSMGGELDAIAQLITLIDQQETL